MTTKVSYCTIEDVFSCLQERKKDTHKGDHGKALIIGGCEDYVGAPLLTYLAAESTARIGVDWVQVAAPEKVAYAINSFLPDLVTTKFKGKNLSAQHGTKLVSLAKKFDAVLIGPGIGLSSGTKSLIKTLVSKIKKPLILDADALKAVSRKFSKKILVTPHEKEFELMFKTKVPKNLNKRVELVKKMAKQKNCVILLKGSIDIISDGVKVKANNTGNPGMTKAGTGDILSGLCLGFIALGNNLFDSACAAAYLNGFAADILKQKMSYSYLASDIPRIIPHILSTIEQKIK